MGHIHKLKVPCLSLPASAETSALVLAHQAHIMSDSKTGTFAVKAGMAQMLKGGVIMDVVDVAQAKIAEQAWQSGTWDGWSG